MSNFTLLPNTGFMPCGTTNSTVTNSGFMPCGTTNSGFMPCGMFNGGPCNAASGFQRVYPSNLTFTSSATVNLECMDNEGLVIMLSLQSKKFSEKKGNWLSDLNPETRIKMFKYGTPDKLLTLTNLLIEKSKDPRSVARQLYKCFEKVTDEFLIDFFKKMDEYDILTNNRGIFAMFLYIELLEYPEVFLSGLFHKIGLSLFVYKKNEKTIKVSGCGEFPFESFARIAKYNRTKVLYYTTIGCIVSMSEEIYEAFIAADLPAEYCGILYSKSSDLNTIETLKKLKEHNVSVSIIELAINHTDVVLALDKDLFSKFYSENETTVKELMKMSTEVFEKVIKTLMNKTTEGDKVDGDAEGDTEGGEVKCNEGDKVGLTWYEKLIFGENPKCSSNGNIMFRKGNNVGIPIYVDGKFYPIDIFVKGTIGAYADKFNKDLVLEFCDAIEDFDDNAMWFKFDTKKKRSALRALMGL